MKHSLESAPLVPITNFRFETYTRSTRRNGRKKRFFDQLFSPRILFTIVIACRVDGKKKREEEEEEEKRERKEGERRGIVQLEAANVGGKRVGRARGEL